MSSVAPVYRGLAILTGAGSIGVLASAYGASPSNTDNLPALTAAIDAVSTGGGGLIYLDPGVYTIDGTLVMQEDVGLIGAGKFATTIFEAATGAMTKYSKSDMSATWQTSHTADSSFPIYPVVAVEKGGSRKTGIRIESLTIDCNGANQADTPANAGNTNARSYCGLFRTNADGIITRNVHIKDAGLSLAGDVATTGCRGYCYFTADAINCFDENLTGDNSRYDVWGARGYSSGICINCVMGSTTGTNCRGSWQLAYQCETETRGWTFVGCEGNNTNATVVSANGFMAHGTRGFTIIDCTFKAVAGHGFYSFGDNTNNTNDSPFDQYNTLPSLTNDEFTDRVEIVSMRCSSSGTVPTVNIDTQFIRDIHVGSLWVHHTTGDAPGVQVGGGSNKSKRLVFDHVHVIIDSIKQTGLYLLNTRHAHIKSLTTVFTGTLATGLSSANGLWISGSSDTVVDRAVVYSLTATGINAAIIVDASASNVSLNSIGWYANTACTFAFGVYIENNTSYVRVKDVGTDISGLITFTANKTVHFVASRGAGSKLFDSRANHTFEQGTGTITAGNTSVTVNFATRFYTGSTSSTPGASWNTPALKNVQITSNSALGTGLNLRVSAINTEGFTANLAAAAAADVSFGWVVDNQHV